VDKQRTMNSTTAALSILLLFTLYTTTLALHNLRDRRFVNCRQLISSPKRSCKCFKNKGNSDYDLCSLNGIIAAYQIKWKNGKFSKWFVPRLNDLNTKRNLYYRRCHPFEKTQPTRAWTYFYSHTHKYILCKIASTKVDMRVLHSTADEDDEVKKGGKYQGPTSH